MGDDEFIHFLQARAVEVEEGTAEVEVCGRCGLPWPCRDARDRLDTEGGT